MTTKTGLKLGNGAQVQATMIVWPIEKLSEVISYLDQKEKDALNYRLCEKGVVAAAKSYHTLVEVEDIKGYSYSSQIPITMPETANAILEAFTNETNCEMGHYFKIAYKLPHQAEPEFFDGKVFPEIYSMVLSQMQGDMMGDGDKCRPEPQQYPQQTRALTVDERVAALDKQFLEIWDEFRWLIPEGEYRVTPQFKVGPLDEDSEGTIANSLGHVMSIANAAKVLEKLNVDDLPLVMTPSVTKAATDARKREVLLDWLRENSDTLAEVMSLEPIEPAPSLEVRASHDGKVKKGSDLFRHE